jgi:zinc protease
LNRVLFKIVAGKRFFGYLADVYMMRKTTFISACLVFLLFLISPCFSETNVVTTELDNGLTLLTLEDHSSPLVAVVITYHVGSRDELAGNIGLTRICSHIIREGTPTYKKGEFARIIQAGGGTTNISPSNDMTMSVTKVPSSMQDTVLFLEADRMQNVVPTYEKLLIAKDALRKERIAYVENSIYGHINEEFMNLAYRSHPYQNPIYGWPDDIDNISLETTEDYFQTYFQPANALVTIAGDIKNDKTIKKVRELFENIMSSPIPERRKIVEPVQYGERYSYLEGSAGIPAFIIGYHVPEIVHEDIPALRLISDILTGGESSRIYKRMVIEENSALYVGGGYLELEDPGMVYSYAILNYDCPNEIGENQMKEEIQKIKTDPVSDSDLEKAKNTLEVTYYRQIRFLEKRAAGLAYFETTAGDWSLFENLVPQARAVTKEKILTIARKYFTKSNRTVVYLTPTESMETSEANETE